MHMTSGLPKIRTAGLGITQDVKLLRFLCVGNFLINLTSSSFSGSNFRHSFNYLIRCIVQANTCVQAKRLANPPSKELYKILKDYVSRLIWMSLDNVKWFTDVSLLLLLLSHSSNIPPAHLPQMGGGGYCLYCVFVLFHSCIFILICFFCTSARTTATEW